MEFVSYHIIRQITVAPTFSCKQHHYQNTPQKVPSSYCTPRLGLKYLRTRIQLSCNFHFEISQGKGLFNNGKCQLLLRQIMLINYSKSRCSSLQDMKEPGLTEWNEYTLQGWQRCAREEGREGESEWKKILMFPGSNVEGKITSIGTSTWVPIINIFWGFGGFWGKYIFVDF